MLGCMETTLHEIAEGIYRLSTHVPEVPPAGFTFSQFLVVDREPLLFHCGPRAMFPLVCAAVARVLPVQRSRWITFGHVEADECGSMNQPPRPLADGEVLDLGRHRLRQIPTPHVPHAWEAQLFFDETR